MFIQVTKDNNTGATILINILQIISVRDSDAGGSWLELIASPKLLVKENLSQISGKINDEIYLALGQHLNGLKFIGL